MESEKKIEKCNTNPIGKIVRIVLSLVIIGFGIFYKNPVGLLGFMTLYTAISGNCGFSIKLNRSKHEKNPNVIDDIQTWQPGKNTEE